MEIRLMLTLLFFLSPERRVA